MPKSEEMPFDIYLQTVLAQLSMLKPAERALIQAELEAHLADAAQDRGSSSDDPALQAAVIAELGSAQRLGQAWAEAYRRLEGKMHGLMKLGFWVVWVLASMIGWVAVGQARYDTANMWYLPLDAMLVIVLQSLVLRSVAGMRWWWHWLAGGLIPWTIVFGLYLIIPWASLPEPQWELTFFSSLLFVTLATGIGQWLVLRRHVGWAAVWLVVPLMSFAAALMLSLMLNAALLGMPDVITRLGGWQGRSILVGLVFGAAYGAATGSVLLGLMHVREFRQSQRTA